LADSQKTVFTDDEVAPQVTNIVQEAKQYVIITTPYLKLWRHAQTALGLAVRRGIKVTVIVRSENGVLKSDEDDLTWLLSNGIEVGAAEYLHAKIYLNEQSVFVSSMNLTEFSTKNSLEIGLAVQDKQAIGQIRDYVKNTVMQLAVPLGEPQPAAAPQPATRHAQPASPAVAGTCIRCGRPVPPDPSKPLCDDCYDVWAEYGNEDYAEEYCHACGKPSDVSYAKPLCRDCFRKLG
jgi:phosphatidylserine/phosphatidylglycerophosphate/cardiolipin synthase-like enzyme